MIAILLAMNAGGLALGQNQSTNQPIRPVSRIMEPVENSRRVMLRGNVNPLARPEFDRGPVSPALAMNRMVLVLKRSDDQEAALQILMAQQQDPTSPNFHHWLSASEFGAAYGISDQDLAKVTDWLLGEGFSLDTVSQGRGAIEFSGTAAQVDHSFAVQMHRYVVDGAEHIANSLDPQIPEALMPVIRGIASLHNFFARSQGTHGRHVRKDLTTGKFVPVDHASISSQGAKPNFTYTNGYNETEEDVTPFDFATIYNILPLWKAGINGTGQTIAIPSDSNITLADATTFQSAFLSKVPTGYPAFNLSAPTVLINGSSPGVNGDAGEATEDVELSNAVAPNAKIVLVVSASTSVTDGILLSEQYIVNHQVASILSSSYGQCELYLGTAGNAAYNQNYQQGAAEGISIFVSAGDSGSAGCESHNRTGPVGATTGLQVNGHASSPYVTAVGGTDLNWQPSATTYWNTTNDPNTGASAKGYIPEVPWNATCSSPYIVLLTGTSTAEQSCNYLLNGSFGGFVNTIGGSGGVSACTTSDGSTAASCSGGYAKPSWQVATGVPNDGLRDIPDVSLFASFGFEDGVQGSSYLICYSSASHPCVLPTTTSSPQITYQENGGTSASTPAMAGIMALVNQQVGEAQGLANPMLYSLFRNQASLANCNTNTVGTASGCVFNDVTTGTNAMPCVSGDLNCVTTTGGDQVGILSGYNAGMGYDLTTGLGSVNVANLVAAWKAAFIAPAPGVITISPQTVTSGIVGGAYSQQFTATTTGAVTFPLTYSATGLPPGLSISSSGLLSGSPTTSNTYTVQITATDSSSASVGGPFTGTAMISLTIHPASDTAAIPLITWNPAHTTLFVHAPIGSNVLDATASVPGFFTYTASIGSQTPVPITASSEFSQQSYTLTANFTPTDTIDYTAASATIAVSVVPQTVDVVNSTGSFSLLYPDGTAITSNPSSGGGIGIAISLTDTISSIGLSGTVLNTVSYTGSAVSPISGGGLVSGTALATDSEGTFWMTNANNSISEFIQNLTAISPSTGFTGGGMNNPSGIAIDLAGNLWIANKGNNSVTELLGVAYPTAPIVNEVKTGGRP